MSSRSRTGNGRAAAVLALVGSILAGCGGPPDRSGETVAPAAARIDRYEVVGEIVELPAPDRPDSGLRVRHEPIPGFRAPDGAVVGMGAMTMSFTPAREVDLSGYAVGDRIRMVWEVVDGGASERVVTIEPLR